VTEFPLYAFMGLTIIARYRENYLSRAASCQSGDETYRRNVPNGIQPLGC